ncbi:hypothetical protein ABEW34_27610 [Paenibacillus algorifonticola]|uniref:hypothetical protein n=1 Tax=Paenibacillus algorifonticola TaxID=684063 RepID=UPI003D2B7B93
MNYRSVENLINNLRVSKDTHPYKESIISILEKFRPFARAKNIERVYLSIAPIQYIISNLMELIRLNEMEKISAMASSIHNYPSFILGEYYCRSIDFWNEHIDFYNRVFESDFMMEWNWHQYWKHLYSNGRAFL